MIIELLLPALSPTMEEGTIAAWLVAKGDQIKPGQVIAEVQTDKAVNEWESLDKGYVAEFVLQPGEQAKVNMVAAILTSTEGEDIGDAVEKAKAANAALMGSSAPPQQAAPEPEPEAAAATSNGAPTVTTAPPPAPAPQPAPVLSPTPSVAAPAARLAPGRQRVSPVAARIALDRGIDLGSVNGSGPDGRIVKRDVEAAVGRDGGGAVPDAGSGIAPGAHQDLAVSQMRQVIGRRLLESKQQIPHFSVTERIDARALVELRGRLNAVDGVRISFNDLVVKAVALTLVRHPVVNATFHGNAIRRYGSADIAIAVAIPDGLITPILFAAEALTLTAISARVKDLARRATVGALKAEEFQGGSFTISNLGMYGIEEFSAIINPPQVAILAVGGIREEAVVDGGTVVPGRTMRLTLSADHRAVDGADGAAFMRDLRALLENPAALML